MHTNEHHITQWQEASSDQALHEKSANLREHSSVLLQEAQDLRHDSRRLRAVSKSIAAINANPNSVRNRDQIVAVAMRFLKRPQISFSIDIPPHRFEQNSNERHLIVFNESWVLY